MRRTIHGLSVLVIFLALIMGIDYRFGSEIRTFSIILFFAWSVEMLTRNWEEIKEFLRGLYGLDKK